MKVTANTLLRDPSTGDLVSVAAGEDVPQWAVGLVGAHLLDTPTESEKADQPDESEESDQPEKADQPDESWTVADLRDYAKAHDIDLEGATVKADILDAIKG